MTQHIDAVFEHGVLRPLQPLSLAERAKVKVMVSVPEEDVRAALAKIGGSMDSAIDETRGEW